MQPKKTDESLPIPPSIPYPFYNTLFQVPGSVPLSNPFQVSSPYTSTVHVSPFPCLYHNPCPYMISLPITQFNVLLQQSTFITTELEARSCPQSLVPFPVHFTTPSSMLSLHYHRYLTLSLSPTLFKSLLQLWLLIHLLFHAPSPFSCSYHCPSPFPPSSASALFHHSFFISTDLQASSLPHLLPCLFCMILPVPSLAQVPDLSHPCPPTQSPCPCLILFLIHLPVFLVLPHLHLFTPVPITQPFKSNVWQSGFNAGRWWAKKMQTKPHC